MKLLYRKIFKGSDRQCMVVEQRLQSQFNRNLLPVIPLHVHAEYLWKSGIIFVKGWSLEIMPRVNC